MTELKTLKDLQFEQEWKYDTLKALRQEAIKWVKFMRSAHITSYYSDKVNHMGCCDKHCNYHTADTLMEFFNLTEEDLNGRS